MLIVFSLRLSTVLPTGETDSHARLSIIVWMLPVSTHKFGLDCHTTTTTTSHSQIDMTLLAISSLLVTIKTIRLRLVAVANATVPQVPRRNDEGTI